MKFFEDTSAAYDDVKRHGYYVCNGKNYLYRYTAHLAATLARSHMEWKFNDEVYGSVDWSTPLDKPITDIYKERAQQIRDKYDYIILAYSGGSDSDNMLHAFIDNNIKLDEVWIDWPHGLMEKSGFKPSFDLSHENLASEWHYTVEPKLHNLSKNHPDVKIHVSDTASEGIIDDLEDTSLIVGFRTSYQNIRRARYISHYQQQMYDKGIEAVLVSGTDKPVLSITPDDQLAAVFHEMPTVFKSDITDRRRVIIEYFYWTPDYPYIVVNQIHELIKYLQHNIDEFERAEEQLRTNKYAIHRSMNLDRAINLSCYPTWDHAFQTDKFLYTFESNQFNKLLIPFIRKEKFADVYYHRYFKDAAVINPRLIMHPVEKNKARVNIKKYPVMSLENFYKGVIRNV